MKKENLNSVLNYIAAVCFYIAAILGYANDNSMATVWLCLGTVCLSLGTYWLSKGKKDSKDDQNEDGKK